MSENPTREIGDKFHRKRHRQRHRKRQKAEKVEETNPWKKETNVQATQGHVQKCTAHAMTTPTPVEGGYFLWSKYQTRSAVGVHWRLLGSLTSPQSQCQGQVEGWKRSGEDSVQNRTQQIVKTLATVWQWQGRISSDAAKTGHVSHSSQPGSFAQRRVLTRTPAFADDAATSMQDRRPARTRR